MRRTARGQSFLECAISLVGVVVFVYVLLNAWTWLTGTLMGRQASFQATRLAAGQVASAGMPVPYQRPPIRLVGLPDSPGGVPGAPHPPAPPGQRPPAPICADAQPFFDRAEELFEEAAQLMDQGLAKVAEIDRLSQHLAWLAGQVRVVCERRRGCRTEGPLAEIAATQAELSRVTQEMQALMDQAQEKMEEAQEQIQQGMEACAPDDDS